MTHQRTVPCEQCGSENHATESHHALVKSERDDYQLPPVDTLEECAIVRTNLIHGGEKFTTQAVLGSFLEDDDLFLVVRMPIAEKVGGSFFDDLENALLCSILISRHPS